MSARHVDVPDLVDVARETLVDELLPLLPASRRYEALMVCNALAIAARALRVDVWAEARPTSRVFRLVGGFHPEDGDPHRLLARLIRRGDFDPDGPRGGELTALVEHLHASVRERLAVDNPKLVVE